MASNSRSPGGRKPNSRPSGGFKGKENNPAKRSPHRKTAQDKNPRQKWADGPGLISSRRQLEIEQKQAEKAEQEKFLKPPASDEYFATTGYFVWVNEDIDPDELLGDRLNDIRKSCHVYIRFLDDKRCLQIDSNVRGNVDNAIKTLRSTVKQVEAETSLFAPLFIVDPPSPMVKKNFVSPVFKEVSETGKKSIEKVILSGPELSIEERAAWSMSRDSVLDNNKKLFVARVQDALEGLRGIDGYMKLKIHFGHHELQRYKRGFGQDYPYEDFVKMMRQSQTNADFNTSMGDLSFASKVVEMLRSESDIFYPSDSRFSDVTLIKPRHWLLVWARGPTNELVRLEAELEPTREDHEKGGDSHLQLGTYECFRDGAKKIRSRVGVLSFEREFDWSFELATEEQIHQPPTPYVDLLEGSVRNPVESYDKFGFPYPRILRENRANITVEDMRLRSTLRFRIKGTPYTLAVALIRQVGVGPSASIGHCEISMYDSKWDDDISDKEMTPSVLFSTEESKDGLQSLLNNVEMVQHYLGKISKTLP